jgi:glycerol-3-phosphate dehydrogenase (NAD(P)+)
MTKVAILGAGAWGSALANMLVGSDTTVTLWGHNSVTLDEIARSRSNERYLPGIKLSADLQFNPNLAEAVAGAQFVIVSVPSRVFREVAQSLNGFEGVAVSVTKGLEYKTSLTMSGVLRETAPKAKVAALSGPTLAPEVARGIPAAIVAASECAETAVRVQRLLHRPQFRVYTSNDVRGVELGGALKNVIAISAGICDGLGFGDNSKAALVTRSLAEIRRLGVACGAQAETFSGLSGLGDLMVTCFSRLSRNRSFGERLGRGEKLETVVATSPSVAEGYPTARSAYEVAHRLNISIPVIDEVYSVLYEGKNPAKALRDLTARELKAED